MRRISALAWFETFYRFLGPNVFIVGMRLKGGSADGTLVAAASMPPSNISAQWAEKYLDKVDDENNCNLARASAAAAVTLSAPNASSPLTTCSFCTADDLNINKKYQGFDQTCSSSESSPGEEVSASITSESSDSEEVTAPPVLKRGIINPNYPGFQHLADQLLNSCDEDIACLVNNKNKLKNINNNIIHNNNVNDDNNNNANNSERIRNATDENLICAVDSVNQLSGDSYKTFYDTPKFNIPVENITSDVRNISLEYDSPPKAPLGKNLEDLKTGSELLSEVYSAYDKCVGRNSTNMATNIVAIDLLKDTNKMADAFLSGVKDEIKPTVLCKDTNKTVEDILDKLNKDEKGKSPAGEKKEKEDDAVVPRKKEKMEINYSVKKNWSHSNSSSSSAAASAGPGSQGLLTCRARPESTRSASSIANRRSLPMMREKKKISPESLGSFDVYNIETAMPYIDLDAIESHLKAAREEDLRRRNDREEIRRRLATGCDTDEYYGGDRPGKKPSLQARLQSGMNLQICFMNDTMSDTESPGTETPETASVTPSPIKAKTNPEPPRATNLPNKQCVKSGLSLPLNNSCAMTEADFFARQARLQSEARVALAQAKDMARMQMEVERQQRQASPITEMISLVGVHFPEERRRLSRQMLTDMNLAQLQVIVNDLHTQIEYLNEGLVKFLMERDDLHMSQDSMLVDIEDLTRYLGAKENTLKEDISQNNNVITPNPKINRIANGV
ncbi:hypothetical protein LSTR_LSTR006153 [Laodelphax striatellus]|uniref:Schwannomin interacting protein 1 C-terminal domain-containing protein n=1 Tax=Laodelphax striatellus TaxID=195883 RepID=A0A482WYG5_LAOST|nr:hypothetical protein LSTR_LSTR006153 [Laodelphax striatellus]